jgi:hypothetical protein
VLRWDHARNRVVHSFSGLSVSGSASWRPAFVYVVSEFSEEMVESIAKLPMLQPFIDEGFYFV